MANIYNQNPYGTPVGQRASYPAPQSSSNTLPTNQQARPSIGGFLGSAWNTIKNQLDFSKVGGAPSASYAPSAAAQRDSQYQQGISQSLSNVGKTTSNIYSAVTAPLRQLSNVGKTGYDQNGSPVNQQNYALGSNQGAITIKTPSGNNQNNGNSNRYPVYGDMTGGNSNPNQSQIDAINSQISQKQNQLNSVNQQGLTNFDINAQGQVVPQQNTGANTGGGNSTSTNTPDYNGLYGQLISQLQAKSQAPSQDYTNIQNQIGQNLAQQRSLTQDYAQKDKNIQGTAGFLTQATGLEGLLNRQYGIGQQALSSQYQGLSSQLGAANTQQGLQQQGLGTAAGYAQPTEQFGVKINPITGQPIGGGNFADLAKQGGTLQGIQTGAANAASASGGIQNQQETQIAGYKSSQQQAQNVGSQLTNLINTLGVNPSDINAVNTTIQRIAQNTSDPNYQALNNYISSIANLYSQILTPSGGSTTDTTRAIASSMLNPTSSGKSILQTLQQLDQEASARIAGVSTQNNGNTANPWH